MSDKKINYWLALYPNFKGVLILRRNSKQDFTGFKSCKTKRNIYYKLPIWLGQIFYKWARK